MKPFSECDTECYADYWLCKFITGETFETYPGQLLDRVGLAATLAKYTIVTFNGKRYDLPLIALALLGASTWDLKAASDRIIVENLQPWQIADVPDWIDHIDIFDVLPGEGSLKMYGGKMHSRKLQDLPFDPAESITPEKRAVLRDYCGNDLETTRDGRIAMKQQIELREDMSREFGIDLRSKSDAQMAEAAMKQMLAFKPERPHIPPGSEFTYRPPAWLKFDSLDILEQLARLPFSVNAKGGVSPHHDARFVDWGKDQVRMNVHGQWVSRPEGWKSEPVKIGNSFYQMGLGGLHSMESNVCHVADQHTVLRDHDVRSYYPSLILLTGIFPQQIGPAFAKIYRGWYDKRLAAKDISEDKTQTKEVRAAAKKVANSLKTLLNGVFGKLGSWFSIFYAPSEMIQVTLTGQLALLMLIERMEFFGIPVISANTDGIVLKCPRHMEGLADSIIKWWEGVTGLDTERTDYKLLAQRDVNSYVAITLEGEVKLKGAYAPPLPGPSGWPNPTGQISSDAVVAYLKNGTPLETTVLSCVDPKQFVHVRQVKGGGYYCPAGIMAPANRATQIAMRNALGPQGTAMDKATLIATYGARADAHNAQRHYLGKAVRWYYSRGSQACITTPTGGMVARTHGCKPMMELTPAIPPDVDHQWYIDEARSLLADLGIK